MPEQSKGDGVSANALKCTETHDLDARHARVVALRVLGKNWKGIAAELGVDVSTVYRWRDENPNIDRAIAEESNDYLVSARHHFASLLPLGAKAMKEILQAGNQYVQDHDDPNMMVLVNAKDRIAATKLIVELFSTKSANTQQPIPPAASSAVAGTRAATSAVITDAELERVLDAELSEPDQREPT